MEFLESTNFFVRVTIYDYRHRMESIKLKFRLIPMVHIGEQRFYDLVEEKILECDELIYEGIQRKSGRRIINLRKKLSERLNLVLQNDGLKMKGENIKLTHGDFTEEESVAAWKKVRLIERLKDRITDPIRRYFQYKHMTRKKLAKYFMQSYKENYLAYGPRFDELGTIENFYMASREQKLMGIIADRIANESEKDKMIGILYGASHMDRFSRKLIDKHSYHVYNGQFLKVFDVK